MYIRVRHVHQGQACTSGSLHVHQGHCMCINHNEYEKNKKMSATIPTRSCPTWQQHSPRLSQSLDTGCLSEAVPVSVLRPILVARPCKTQALVLEVPMKCKS
jgi:hypothetical protein